MRIARMAAPWGSGKWVKLEVIPDPKYLLPDPIGTLEAARTLVDEGFAVLPYIGADPPLARRLAELGCATVMPLARRSARARVSSISRRSASSSSRRRCRSSSMPGSARRRDAALAMEQGADACLVNTAIALAREPGADGGSDRRRRCARAGKRFSPVGYRDCRMPRPAVRWPGWLGRDDSDC